MDLNTFLLVAGGIGVAGIGLYGWSNWNKSFGKPKNIPEPEVVVNAKPKRKYTKKPKAAVNLQTVQAQSQQKGEQLRPSYPPPNHAANQQAQAGAVASGGNGLDHGASLGGGGFYINGENEGSEA